MGVRGKREVRDSTQPKGQPASCVLFLLHLLASSVCSFISDSNQPIRVISSIPQSLPSPTQPQPCMSRAFSICSLMSSFPNPIDARLSVAISCVNLTRAFSLQPTHTFWQENLADLLEPDWQTDLVLDCKTTSSTGANMLIEVQHSGRDKLRMITLRRHQNTHSNPVSTSTTNKNESELEFHPMSSRRKPENPTSPLSLARPCSHSLRVRQVGRHQTASS